VRKINGEFVIDVDHVCSDDNFVSPRNPNCPSNDLCIVDTNGQYFHIRGTKNDWGYLAAELLLPIMKKGNKLYFEISSKISEINPEVVLVGKNEFRLLDIIHLIKDGEEGIKVIKSIPIVKGNFDNGVKFLGKKSGEEYLPFM